MRPRWHAPVLALLVLSCGPGLVHSDETSDASGSGSSSNDGTAPGVTSVGPTSGGADEGTTQPPPASSGMPELTGTTVGTDTTTGACDPTELVDCGGTIYACGDGIDDDGDGLVDLQDPDCLSPCDDTEDQFEPGLPGDNISCVLDCGFDGNTGSGDDQCRWNIRCDPLDPGASAFCEYDRQLPCEDQLEIPEICVESCTPFIPNGCDCFGCCTFMTDAGPIDLWTGAFDCGSADLSGCPPCTSHMELCGNPCEPDACEICVGQLEPPHGCDAVGCVGGTPCDDNCDCEPDGYCVTGCCHPPPWG